MRILFIAFFTLFVLGSCASSPQKREPLQASPSVEQEFRAGESSARAGDHKKAIARLSKVVQEAPESNLSDDAFMLLGHSYFALGQFEKALANYRSVFAGEFKTPLEIDARLRVVRTQLSLSKSSDAIEELEESSNWGTLNLDQAIELEKLKYETFAVSGRNIEALHSLVVLTEKLPNSADRDRYRALAQDILESKLSESELYEAASRDRFGFLSAAAKFRYANIHLDRLDYSRARRYLSEAAALAPGSELAERAQGLIQQIDARNQVDPKTIGVVLPLSGKQAAIGQKALRGIQLGLGIYGSNGNSTRFRLAVMDSEGSPDVARRAVDRLVQEDNVIAIIGGLLSKTASAEATKAQEFGVPSIMLSQKAGVTQVGDSVFRNALTSQMQVQALVDLAMNRLGHRSFGIIYPNDAYGIEYANLFWDEVRARGGEISGAQSYDPKETDFRGHVQRLVGTFYLEDRAEEYRTLAQKFYEKNPNRSARQGGPSIEDILPPIVDFDAIFIPDNARAVGQIAPMLAYNNVNKVRLLGTNLWNSPGLIQRGQKFVEDSVFIDGLVANDPALRNSAFFANFRAVFQEDAGLTELQAYDSAMILRQLVAGGERTRVGLQNKMTTLRQFPGATGPLSVNSNREFLRPLAALTVRDGAIVPLESSQPQ
jgi:branched-chain amino acid transport system substrate-binding protein